MAAGLGQSNRESMDAKLGAIMQQLNTLIVQQVEPLFLQINGLGSAGLQALPSIAATPTPYSSTDAGIVINAITDAHRLAQIYLGNAFLAAGSTVNGATYTVANNTTTFGYNFQTLNIGKTFGIGIP